MKICSKCNIEKEDIFFGKLKRSKDKLNSVCKECRNNSVFKYRKDPKNKKRIEASIIKSYNKNKSKIKIRHKEFYHKNKKVLCKDKRDRYEKDSSYNKRYFKENINRIKIRENAKYKENINYKLRKTLRNRLFKSVKNNYKTGSAVRDLGCSIEELKAHLESKFYPNPETGEEMTWENHSYKGWHIDHIIPLSSFDLSNREELLKACHYTNLQPLWAKENLSKGAKYEK